MNSESLSSTHSDTDPDAESNASFIQKMTSKASGLLPQFISKWFGSPTHGEGVHRGIRALPETDSSADEDEDNASSRPPAKRMRLDFTDRVGNHTTSCQTQTEIIRTVETSNSTYESVREMSGPSDYRLQLQSSASTPLYGGRSSNCAPTTSREAQGVDFANGISARKPVTHTQEASPPTQSMFDPNADYKARFLNSTKNEAAEVSVIKSTQNKTPSRPYFKPALVGSPFYPGRTMYGGAYNTASYLNKSPVYNPRKLTVKPPPSTANTTMSQTAKRIFDLLEDYSSPMKDAKRIPVMNSTPLAVRRTDSEESLDSANDSNLVKSLKINRMRDLNPPSIPALLRMKRNNRLMDTTQEARWIAASHSSSLHMSTPYLKKQPAKKPEESDFQGKLKTRVTRREPVSSDAAPPPAVSFANAALSIGSSDLPTFSFSTPKLKEPLPSVRVSTARAGDKPQETPKAVKESDKFQFSNPIDVLHTSAKTTLEVPNLCPKTSSFSIIPNNVPSWSDKLNQQHSWQCKKCWSNNKMDVKTCVSCGSSDLAKDDESPKSKTARKAPETFSDRFGKRKSTEPVPAPSEKKIDTGFSDIIKQQQKKWECASCLTRNAADKNKCVCCDGDKPGAAPSKDSKEAKSGFEDIMKQQKQQWECSSCLTRNKSDSAKCACCESAKPGSSVPVKAAVEKTGAASDSGFADLIKQQNERWECAICMTRNEDNRLKCACCESAKPGAPKPQAAVGIKFDFKKTPDTTFKFGIDKADVASVDKTDSKLENISNNNVPSVTNENKPPPTGFTFSKPIDKPLTNCDSSANVKRSLLFHTNNGELGKPSPAMTFKLPEKPVVSNPETAKVPEIPAFGSSSIKPAAVPTFNFGAPKSVASTTAPSNATSLFTAPSTKVSTPAPSLGASTAFGGIQTFTTPGQSLTAHGQSLKDPGQTLTAPGQSLTAPGQSLTAPGQSLTAPGQSLTAPGQSLSTPGQTLIAPSQTFTAPSQSLFGIPSSTETNKMSPLQSNLNKPANLGGSAPAPLFSAAPPTTASTNPVFSFGSGSTPLAAISKPGGFNFSFSSNKTEATPTFNAPSLNAEPVLFGATKEATPTFKAPSLNAEPVLFGAPVTKETTPTFNAPSSQSDQILFGASATTGLVNSSGLLGASAVKSPTLTFVSSQPNNMFTAPSQAADSTTTFGASSQLKSNSFFGAKTSTFGETKSPLFGSPIPSFSSNETKPVVFGGGGLFGMSSQNTTPSQPTQSQPLLFGAPQQNQQTTNHFGGPPQTQTAGSLPGSSGLFNNPLLNSIAPTFGAPSGLPQFGESAPQQSLAQPAFNFGSASTPAPSFTFGQSSQPNSQPFSFCASPIPTNSSLQFSMGTSPMSQNATAPAQRRVRKAVRRTNMPR